MSESPPNSLYQAVQAGGALIHGIDYGLEGAIGTLCVQGGRVVWAGVVDLPHDAQKRLAVHPMMLFCLALRPSTLCAYAESFLVRYATAGHHRSSQNYGRLLGVLELSGMPYETVGAAQWKRRAGLIKQPKSASVAKIREYLGPLCPAIRRHDQAEALLIAFDGARQEGIEW